MLVSNRTGRDLSELVTAVAAQPTLEAVVRTLLARRVPRVIRRIVVQDEFTHDVVIEHDHDTWIVYDTT